MSILSGFRKQKRYATDEKGRHQLISTWTHTDTVYDDEGKSLTEIIEELPAADTKVTQTATDDTNKTYEVLFSGSNDNITKAEEARKTKYLKFNPVTKLLSLLTDNYGKATGGTSTNISSADIQADYLQTEDGSHINRYRGTLKSTSSESSLTLEHLDTISEPSVTNRMIISPTNITLQGSTWDGTNTSLKTALAKAGAKVLYGTSAPTSSQGEDGQLYVRLKALNPYLENFTVDYGSSRIIDTELITDNLSDCNVYIKQYQEVAGVETLIYEYDDTIDLGNITSMYIRDENNDPLCTLYSMGGAGMPQTLQIQKDNDNDKLVMTVVDATATADAIDTIYIKDNGSWLIDDGDIPSPTASDVGKVLKATDVGEYDWGAAPDPLPSITSSDNGKVLTARNSNWVKETLPKDAYFINIVFYGGEPTLPTGLGITLADISPSKPVYLLNNTVGSDDNGKVYAPVFIDSTITLGVKENAEWQCISTEIVNGKEVTYVERIVYYMNADDHSEETVTYTKEELSSGGSEAVYKTLAEYEALPTADKEDPTKIYFVINEGSKVSPTLDSDDGNCNATNAPAYAWWCLSGNASTEFQISEGGLSEYNSPAWWSYHFGTRQIFSKVKMRYRNNSSENRVRFSIQASNDGSTWTEILVGNPKYVDLTTENTDMEFVVDTGNVAYEYIRLRFDMPSGWAAGAIKICGNLEIFATANSSSPMIYYKNLLYTPNELPITSTSDTGKALVVNSDGVWDKGDIPRTNSVQVPPVIYDNNKLMKIADMTGFPELEKVFVTSEEYAQLTTVQKQDLSKIYYVSPYKFYTLKDGEITIRVNGTTYEWFFNGFILTDSFYVIPSEYRQYTKNDPYEGSTAWSDNTSSTSLGIIEMGPSGYTERISAQDSFWAGNVILNTPIYGKVVTGNGDSQTNTYSDPYDVETPILIYYGGKQYTEYTTPSVYRELTQAEYDALPSSKNSDGIIYFING